MPHRAPTPDEQTGSQANLLLTRFSLASDRLYWAANALQTVCDGLQDTRPGLWSNLVSAVAQVAAS